MRRTVVPSVVTVLALVLMLPAAALAQSAFAGIVRDTSGAVLPGVTIEIASDVLIERSRIQLSAALQAMAGQSQGTAPLTGSVQNTATSTTPTGIGTRWLITPTTRYAADCKGPCTPGALVDPGMTVSSLSVPLVAPGTELFDRLNQLDVTISKVFVVGATKLEPEMAVFNALNGAAVSAVRSMNYGTASYEQPSTILQGRFIRLGIKMKW